ncbi:MAG: SIS domain-containing protein [Spirochaetales bacterium]|nr:SIS domain-containing protein [Spirochaetales bacterium]
MKETGERGQHTLREIRSQAEAWEGVLRRIEAKAGALRALVEPAEEIVFCGCGSAFNISHAAAPFAQATLGKTCRAVQASDVFLHPQMFLHPKRRTLGVVISRSGSTTESVEALRTLAARGCATLAITCFAESPMAREGSEALVLAEAGERSVTTTRSLTSMVLAGQCLAAVCRPGGRGLEDYAPLPELYRARVEEFEEQGRAVSRDPEIGKYAFVGSGGLYGLAREAQLKIKEMVLLPSDSYVSLDYQHGPMSNVDPRMLVALLVSEAGRPYDLTLARNMKSLGGKVWVLSERAAGFEAHSDYLLELGSGLPEGVRDVLLMPALQFLAYYKSMAAGQDPDRPHNLLYHVEVQPGQ